MIIKNTYLTFAMILLFLVGGESIHGMSEANHFSRGMVNEEIGSTFLQDGSVSSRNAKAAETFSDDLLTEEYTVWSANGFIYVRASKAIDVNIYTITGQLSKRMKVTAGETAIPMPRGLYIVRLENIARKVVVR